MKKNIKQIFIIFIVALIIMIPLFVQGNYHMGDDSEYHVANILALINSHKFYPNDVMPNLFENYGIAIRQFYPVLGHSIGAIISIIFGLNVFVSLKITSLLILFLSGISMYYLSLNLSGKKNIALFSSIVYMLFPYHLSDIYIRDALGESLLFIFIPMIINGLLYLFNDKKKFLLLFCTGYILGMLSHLTLMIYFTLLLIPFFIINRKKIFKKDIIKILIIASIIILSITSFSTVNLIQNKISNNYRVFDSNIMVEKNKYKGLSYEYVNYLSLFDYQHTSDTRVRFFLDFIVLFLLVLLIKNYKKIDLKKYKYFIIFGIISFIMSLIIFPWNMMPSFLKMIQFPFRMSLFFTVSVSLLVPLALPFIKINEKYLIIGMVIFALFSVSIIKYKGYIDLNNVNYSMGIGWQKEYLPNKMYDKYDEIKNREYKIISNEDVNILEDNFPNIKFELLEDSYVEIPRTYYLGYNLYNSNNELENIFMCDNGLICSNLKKGKYELKYERTTISKISYIISLCSLIICLLIWLISYIFNKKKVL